MESITVPLKRNVEENGLVVQYELVPIFQSSDNRSISINEQIDQIDRELEENKERLDFLKSEIDKNTSHADKTDLLFAACSGVMAGLIDVFFVGEFNMREADAWSNKTVNEFVMNVAKKQGYSGDRLDGAIRYLENNYKIPSDSAYMGQDINVSSKSHHLDDMAHHASLIGWIFSLLTQFTGKAFFSNKLGNFNILPANSEYIGNGIAEKLYCGTVNWFFHLVSDMSGSNKTAGTGMGIPGPVMSLAKEVSALPGVNDTGMSKMLNDLYQNDHVDFRKELSIGYELGRQAIPVMINEALVRAFYFLRRFFNEYKRKQNWHLIDWNAVKPCKNATISRMMTVASGTFLLVDSVDAALKSGGTLGGFLLRINIVNVGRFALAVGSEVNYAIKREKLGTEYYKELLVRGVLYNAKLSYQEGAIWLIAKDTLGAIEEAYMQLYQYTEECKRLNSAMENNLYNIRRRLGMADYQAGQSSTDDNIMRMKKKLGI